LKRHGKGRKDKGDGEKLIILKVVCEELCVTKLCVKVVYVGERVVSFIPATNELNKSSPGKPPFYTGKKDCSRPFGAPTPQIQGGKMAGQRST
jgi:hypothetical protein